MHSETSLREAEAITRASKSNLALALVTLPQERKRDMTLFYAFCRVIDDIVDEPGESVENRRSALNAWRLALRTQSSGEPALAPVARTLIQKYQIDPDLMTAIIDGCEMDLAPARYPSWDALRTYCYRVASCVGLVSLSIFGCEDPACRDYAIDLGLALQLTNILRDVGEDFANGGRVYLPADEMARFGFGYEDLEQKRRTDSFVKLMQFEAERARGFYASAVARRPAAERKRLVAAELMRAIYYRILAKMDADGFHVFEKRYRVSHPGKLLLIGKVLLETALASR